MQPMDPQNDPLWKMGQQGEQQHAQRAQQIAQGWANKEQYYQGLLFRFIGGTIPRALFMFLWRYARAVSFVYVLSSMALLVAWIAFFIGWGLQKKVGGFSHLDTGSYAVAVTILVIAAVFFFAACASVLWGFVFMSWAGQILTLFYLYSWGLWLIRAFVASEGNFAIEVTRPWFFCLFASTIIEAAVAFWRRRQAGLPAAI